MYKQITFVFLLAILCRAQSLNLMEGTNTKTRIDQYIMDDFRAEIPQHFEKVGEKYYYVANNESSNWFGAAEKCRQIDGNLINLQDEIELYNVGLKLNSSLEYWTDLNNLVNLKIFYSLTTGIKAELLNGPLESEETPDINMCGLLKFDSITSNFILVKNKCVEKKANFICETTVPTTISFILF